MAKKKARWDRIFLALLAVVAIVVLVWQLQSEQVITDNGNGELVDDIEENRTLTMDPNTVYLTIGDRDFTYGELNAQYMELDSEVRQMYSLDEFIEGQIVPLELLLGEARRQGFVADEEIVEEQVSFITEMALSQGMTFEQYVSMFGFTEEEAMKQISEEVLIQEFLDSQIGDDIEVTEEEVLGLYAMFGLEEQNVTLEEVRGELEDMIRGEKYNEIVMEYIQDLRDNTNVVYHYSAGINDVQEEIVITIGDDNGMEEDNGMVVEIIEEPQEELVEETQEQEPQDEGTEEESIEKEE
ncbi:MAG: hypothetical protein ACMXYL_03090 [Candidatus Woesearchaeota archaeon]